MANGNGTKDMTLEDRIAMLERLVDSEPRLRAKRMGLNPNALTPAEYNAVHFDARYNADPLTPEEEKVIRSFETRVASADNDVAAAEIAYGPASQAWEAAWVELRRIEKETGTSIVFTRDGRIVQPESAPLVAAADAFAAVADVRNEAARVLEKARIRHARVIRDREAALRNAGNSRGIVASIKERLLGTG